MIDALPTSCLSRRALLLIGASGTLMLTGCATTPTRRPLRKRDLSKVTLDPGAALALISGYRVQRGLSALRLDPALTAMARTQADAMAAAGVLSHDVAGSFNRRLAAAKIDTAHAAENLGAGYFSLDEAFEGWKASSAHNRNMLLSGMTRFGMALAKAPATDYQTYWAMEVAGEPPRRLPTLGDTAVRGPAEQGGSLPAQSVTPSGTTILIR